MRFSTVGGHDTCTSDSVHTLMNIHQKSGLQGAIVRLLLYVCIVLSPLMLIAVLRPETDHGFIYTVGKKFAVVTNIRSASVSDHLGIVGLELEGEQSEIDAAVKWIAAQGVKVEPIEKNIIE